MNRAFWCGGEMLLYGVWHEVRVWVISILTKIFNFRYNTAVSSLSFSHDGSALAIACSQLDESQIEDPKPEDIIYIRYVTDQETKPKWGMDDAR